MIDVIEATAKILAEKNKLKNWPQAKLRTSVLILFITRRGKDSYALGETKQRQLPTYRRHRNYKCIYKHISWLGRYIEAKIDEICTRICAKKNFKYSTKEKKRFKINRL